MRYTLLGLYLVIIFCLSLGNISANNTLTLPQVATQVQNVQSATSTSERGFIGNIIANLFQPSGRIKTMFLSPFQTIEDTAFHNTLPRWTKLNNATEGRFELGTIQDTGSRVGIGGTPHTTATLRVNGLSRFDELITANNGIGATNLNLLGSSTIVLATNNNPRMMISSSGNIGIGTMTPSERLHVSGKILAQSPVATDGPNTVVTKGYLESVIAGLQPAPPSNCTTPWGANVNHGSSVTAFLSSSVPSGNTCTSQTRTCTDGTLSGSYTNQSCSVQSPSFTYSWQTGSYGTCSRTCGGGTQTRSVTCRRSDGVTVSDSLCSGTRPTSSRSCNTQACPLASCSLPWGGSISSGQSVTAFLSSSVPSGNTCTSQTRTCTNGVLSGSYSNQSCTVQAPSYTYSWQTGGYGVCSVSCGGGTQTRSVWCRRSDGATVSDSLCSGTRPASSQSCNTQACPLASCSLPWGGSIPHGGSVTAWQTNREAGPFCRSQIRTCNNGSLSGTYNWQNCEQIEWRCFTPETQVLMADGSLRDIAKIQVGDIVQGKNGINKVVGIDISNLGERKLYGFNGQKGFVTAEHPFMTHDGWKSINVEALKLDDASLIEKLSPTNLIPGDTIIMADGSTQYIESIEEYSSDIEKVYNLKLDGDGIYFANGFMTHHKY